MHASKGRVVLSPSDVTAHLACTHLTTLSLSVARGDLVAPPFENEQAELIFRKGREHEHAYLQQLEREGKTIAKVSLKPDFDWQRAARETEAAMQAGVDVVYQAALVGDQWRGQADFLLRVETPSELGLWSHEALGPK